MMSRLIFYRIQTLCMFALAALPMLSSCARQNSKIPQVTVSQIEPYLHAAKPPDCSMPILYSEPRTKYRKIAIVEGWVRGPEQKAELLAALQRKACETGADALLVLQQRFQSTGALLESGEIRAGVEDPVAEGGISIADRLQKEEHFTQQGEAGFRGYYINAVATNLSDHK
jgi:hypothetical protein